jgi:hypothetical protein
MWVLHEQLEGSDFTGDHGMVVPPFLNRRVGRLSIAASMIGLLG